MPAEDTKKRKACKSCTRAKAKCSPFENRQDLCYRCQRLNKPCIYEEATRKRGPKTRSRVKQLEQRVDTLIDLLANGQGAGIANPPAAISDLPIRTPDVNAPSISDVPDEDPRFGACGPAYVSPVDTPDAPDAHSSPEPFKAYDPVEAGVINKEDAADLLKEFKESFMPLFPFVAVPEPTGADELRQQQPFLFHAILAVTSSKTPRLQALLAEQLKDQIVTRLIARSQKSLEILQGLLLYAGFYHNFYHSQSQQLAIMIQLCVALVQDMSLLKNLKDKSRRIMSDFKCNRELLPNFERSKVDTKERSSAEQRAFLGAYYLTAEFAQTWRKRSTMPYTRYMGQACDALAEHQEYASDALIAPLIRTCEFMNRVNDYFSYDDIENAEVRGDMMFEVSTTNFRRELEQLRASVPPALMATPVLNLKFSLLDIWIHECALHGSLWTTSRSNRSPLSPVRIKILHRSMTAMKSYINTLIGDIPQSSMHHLAFPVWSGWLYATIVACKLVFLVDIDNNDGTDFAFIPNEVTDICTHEKFNNGQEVPAVPLSANHEEGSTSWDPVSVAKEAEVQSLFSRFFQKMHFTLPPDIDKVGTPAHISDPLFRITFLQQSLFIGFTKRLKAAIAKAEANGTVSSNAPTMTTGSTTSTDPMQYTSTDALPITEQAGYVRQRLQSNPVPLIDQLQFDSLNFDSIMLPDVGPPHNGPFDDWVWDMAMDGLTIPQM